MKIIVKKNFFRIVIIGTYIEVISMEANQLRWH